MWVGWGYLIVNIMNRWEKLSDFAHLAPVVASIFSFLEATKLNWGEMLLMGSEGILLAANFPEYVNKYSLDKLMNTNTST